MTTVVEDCQFVCITQADYYKILHEGEDALVREEDEQGELVKVSEVRRTDDGQKHAKVKSTRHFDDQQTFPSLFRCCYVLHPQNWWSSW